MQKDSFVGIRLALSVKQALSAAAAAHRRSLSSLVVIILSEWLKKMGFLK